MRSKNEELVEVIEWTRELIDLSGCVHWALQDAHPPESEHVEEVGSFRLVIDALKDEKTKPTIHLQEFTNNEIDRPIAECAVKTTRLTMVAVRRMYFERDFEGAMNSDEKTGSKSYLEMHVNRLIGLTRDREDLSRCREVKTGQKFAVCDALAPGPGGVEIPGGVQEQYTFGMLHYEEDPRLSLWMLLETYTRFPQWQSDLERLSIFVVFLLHNPQSLLLTWEDHAAFRTKLGAFASGFLPTYSACRTPADVLPMALFLRAIHKAAVIVDQSQFGDDKKNILEAIEKIQDKIFECLKSNVTTTNFNDWGNVAALLFSTMEVTEDRLTRFIFVNHLVSLWDFGNGEFARYNDAFVTQDVASRRVDVTAKFGDLESFQKGLGYILEKSVGVKQPHHQVWSWSNASDKSRVHGCKKCTSVANL